jgi:hypothetical protein
MARRKLKEPPVNWVSYFDLQALEPVMEQITDTACKARHVSLEDLFRLFHDEVQPKLRALALKLGVDYIVCFENIDLTSRWMGHRSAVAAVAPDTEAPGRWTLEFILQTAYMRIGRSPSRWQVPVAYRFPMGPSHAIPVSNEGTTEGTATSVASSALIVLDLWRKS